jgi:hypothetical protein
MQYMNPIDRELIASSEGVQQAMTSLCAELGLAPDALPMLSRMSKALFASNLEMKMQEEADKIDPLTSLPPTSND